MEEVNREKHELHEVILPQKNAEGAKNFSLSSPNEERAGVRSRRWCNIATQTALDATGEIEQNANQDQIRLCLRPNQYQ